MVEFGSSISGMRLYETRQAVSAHDISNVNTKGFEESDVIQSDKGSLKGVNVADIRKVPNSNPELSNTDLAKEMPEQMVNITGYKANASAIKTQDQMLGSLMEIVG